MGWGWVLSLESVDGTETCEEGQRGLPLRRSPGSVSESRRKQHVGKTVVQNNKTVFVVYFLVVLVFVLSDLSLVGRLTSNKGRAFYFHVLSV